MDHKLYKHSQNALHDLKKQIEGELKRREKASVELEKIRKTLIRKGISIDVAELLKPKVEPMFRHAKIPGLTWSGRGRAPKWIVKFGVKI